uniref:methionine synthase reductase-like n=1 Tax=Styela clava TaxID=7725 RepID=UPI001939B615|nr:methionine synthase reductase-like [Styela clava]
MAKDEIVVMYGSQTGQAETIAETIHETAEEHEIKSTLYCLRKADECFKMVSEENVPVVFVCSTTGDGELPGTARKFVRMIQRRTLENDYLSKLHYALLGLGDSNYSTFCGGPKTLQRSLKKLGAKSFYSSGFADDGTDLEMVVEPWIEGLWPALKSHIQTRQKDPVMNGQHQTDSEISDKMKNINLSTVNNNSSENAALEMDKKSENGKVENERVEIISKDDHSFETDNIENTVLKMNTESSLLDLSEVSEGTLPPAMLPYLTVNVIENQEVTLDPSCENQDITFDHPNENQEITFNPPQFPSVQYPLAASDKFHSVTVKSIKKLTSEGAVKTALCVTLGVGEEFLYEPGDSFGIVVPNPTNEVDWLIRRFKAESFCDKTIEIEINPQTKKKNAKVPNFIPKICTIRYLLEECLEIRSVPKKTLLRTLINFTASESERNILTQLCRKESMADFIKYIREPNLNILDVLAALPSCHPPLEVLFEHLPRLKARLYSAASCLKAHPGEVKFVFNVLNFDSVEGRMYQRKGLCTGYLESLFGTVLDSGISTDLPKLTIFKTKNESFRLSPLLDPVVMIGPGTGVAPFIGFLESLKLRKTETGKCPEAWLFYGCRNKNQDFLFKNELESFVENGVLSHLVVSFSRDTPPKDGTKDPKYVQDNLELYSNEIFDLLWRRDANFYVCGDAKNMAKDVRETLIQILSKEMSLEHAEKHLKTLVKEGRYKEDVWT